MVIFVRPLRRRNENPGHDRAAAHRLSPGCDQTVAQPERPQAGDVRRMPLRPGGGQTVAVGFLPLPAWRVHGRHRLVSGLPEGPRHMVAELYVELFPVFARPRPPLGGQGLFPGVVESGTPRLPPAPTDPWKL